MSVELENQKVRIEVKPLGAELASIFNKENDQEYLWQADESIWARHAPILFPIVGRLRSGKYNYKGKEYTLPQHGFARDNEFTLVEQTDSKIKFQLKSSADTLKNYPFNFSLFVSYELLDTTVKVSYRVVNEDEKSMPFSIGAHPGFNCPIAEDESYEDYYLEFEKEENLTNHLLKDGLLDGETEDFGRNVKKIPLTRSLFANDALIFKNLRSKKISLKSTIYDYKVEVSFPDFLYLGLWTKPGTASFLCIEPWFGVADKVDSKGDILKKEAIQILAPGDKFECSYTITVG